MLRALVVLGALAIATSARAESWHEGEHGRNRLIHVSFTAGAGLAYLLTVPLEPRISPESCRWCDPTSLDTSVRDALRWSNTARPAQLSHLMSYAAAPGIAFGLVALGTPEASGWANAIDDFTPIVESLAISLWLTRGLKIALGRQRPYAHFTGPDSYEDNLSLPSGHTSTAFALVTSAASVARARGYRSEPYIWATGLTVAAAAAYFRIAADKHYITDVLAGAGLGTAVGLTVPLLMRRNAPTIAPTRDGVAVVGIW